MIGRVFLYDLRLAFRPQSSSGFSLGFFLVFALLMPLGIGPDQAVLSNAAIGIIWLGLLLASLLTLDRIFHLDFEDGTLELYALTDFPLEGIIAAKIAAHWVVTGLPLSVLALFVGFVLHLPSDVFLTLLLSLLIGSIGLSAIGAFGASICLGLKRGGLLLSLLVLPLSIPTLIFGSQTARVALLGGDYLAPLLISSGVSIATLATLPFAIAFSIRIHIRNL